jgi:isobutyryl-CoA mutase
VTDELVNRFLQAFPDMRIAVLAVDPTRRAPAVRCWATASA